MTLVFQDPPPASNLRNANPIFAELKAHPNKWAVYRDDAKTPNVSYVKRMHPEFTFAGRKNGNGYYTIYIKYNGAKLKQVK